MMLVRVLTLVRAAVASIVQHHNVGMIHVQMTSVFSSDSTETEVSLNADWLTDKYLNTKSFTRTMTDFAVNLLGTALLSELNTPYLLLKWFPSAGQLEIFLQTVRAKTAEIHISCHVLQVRSTKLKEGRFR